MRPAIIAGAAIALWTTAPATAQQETASEVFYGCVSQQLTAEYVDLVRSGDAAASSMFFLNKSLAGKCRVFEKGEPYYFRSTGPWGAGCYRPAGRADCFFRASLPRKKTGS